MNRFQEDVFQNIYDYLDHFDLNQCDEEERLDIVKEPWALGATIESVFLRDIEDIDAYKEAKRLRYGMEPYNDPEKAKAYVKENLYDILDFYSTHRDAPNIHHALMDQQHFLYVAFDYVRKQILYNTLHSDFPHLFKESRTTPLTQEDINAVKEYFGEILQDIRRQPEDGLTQQQIEDLFDGHAYLEHNGNLYEYIEDISKASAGGYEGLPGFSKEKLLKNGKLYLFSDVNDGSPLALSLGEMMKGNELNSVVYISDLKEQSKHNSKSKYRNKNQENLGR